MFFFQRSTGDEGQRRRPVTGNSDGFGMAAMTRESNGSSPQQFLIGSNNSEFDFEELRSVGFVFGLGSEEEDSRA